MSAASKYTFDVEFRRDGDLVSSTARARQKKVYSTEEIDALTANAHEQGRQEGGVRANEALSAEVSKLCVVLAELLACSRQANAAMREEASLLALAAGRKLAGAALAQFPAADVETALRDALRHAIGEPRIVINASRSVVDVLAPRLSEIQQQEGFEGRVVLAADPMLAAADCRIDWRGGGAARTQSAIEGAIAELVMRRFSTSSTTEE